VTVAELLQEEVNYAIPTEVVPVLTTPHGAITIKGFLSSVPSFVKFTTIEPDVSLTRPLLTRSLSRAIFRSQTTLLL
jgi:hypothetical protein